MAVIVSSLICFMLTITNVLPSDKGKWGYDARTDLRKEAIYSSPWFRFPYPGIYLEDVHFLLLCIEKKRSINVLLQQLLTCTD